MKIALPTNDERTLAPKIGLAREYLIIDLDTLKREKIYNETLLELIKKHRKLHGDCGEHGLGIGQVLPKMLKEKGVDMFVARFFGEGMLGNLDLYKIKTHVTQKRNIDEIIKEIKENYGS